MGVAVKSKLTSLLPSMSYMSYLHVFFIAYTQHRVCSWSTYACYIEAQFIISILEDMRTFTVKCPHASPISITIE
jgi:hypothetical protein